MGEKLSKNAYGGIKGKDYVPYISKKNNIVGNIVILIIGILLAALFAASTAYSGMKAGLTVAAGIPGAIVGAGFISVLAKTRGILGTNLVQGMSSGGESVASGIIFVLPAVLLIGGEINFFEGVIVGIAGVLVGIGVASLVHNYLIIEEHGKLMYPEAMAISETLVASSTGGESLKYMGIGFGIGGLITLVTSSFLAKINNTITYVGSEAYKWRFQLEVNPLLIGIGFIVGLEVALTMFAGSLLANFAVNPLIGYFSGMAPDDVFTWDTINNSADSQVALNSMSASDIANSYGKYIGAGMMLCGGIIGAIKLIPVIINALKETLAAKQDGSSAGVLQMVILFAGIAIAFIAGTLISNGNMFMTILGVIVSIILMFLFVIVAGRLTGTIGTSNLPVSGMTIASLVIITLLFIIMGWSSQEDNQSLLLFGTLIVTSIAMSGGYLQSQKVTYVIGGNKNEMQKFYVIAGLVGVIVVVGTINILSSQILDPNGGFAIPQANLMATLTSGIMSNALPWPMIFAGIFIAIVLHFLKLPIMTVAIGFYLPISTTSIILVGALIRLLVEKNNKIESERDARISNGISLSSGLVAGGSIIGLIGIFLQVLGIINVSELTGFAASNEIAIAMLSLLIILIILPIMFGKLKNNNDGDD